MYRPVGGKISSYQGFVNGKNIKPMDQSSDEDDKPPPLPLWDRCEHIRSLIKDLHQDVETAGDKELKDLATELQMDAPSNERQTLVKRIRPELHRYLSEPLESTPSTSRSDSILSEIESQKTEPLVNFKTDNLLVAKEQLIRFITKAGNEKYPKKGYPGPNKEILKQIHQLFNEEYFRREDEYIISNPLELEWHFSEEFIIMAAVKYQYHIVWDTTDGMTDTMIHWQMPISVTPELRKESVQVVLYRRLKKVQQEITDCDLCPPIYARLRRKEGSAVAWQKTVYDPEKKDFFTKPATFPEWITDDDLEVKLVRKMRNKKLGIQTFFFKASLDSFELGEHLHATNTLYYFVVHDKEIADFQEKVRPIEELHPTQAYVGRCPGTILDRWIRRKNSHCQAASRLCHFVKSQLEKEEPFVPGTYKCKASLMECYLALAKVLRYKCALFILYDMNNESDLNTVTKDLICHHNTTNMHRGLNEKEESVVI